MVHCYNPNTQEAEAGGSRVLGQLRLYSETLSQKSKTQKSISAVVVPRALWGILLSCD
jgi:hypothetical protein